MEMARRLDPLLGAFTGEHVGDRCFLFCFDRPELLHIDLKFVTMPDLDRLIERPVVLWSRDTAAVEEGLNRAAISWPNRDPDWFEARAWTWLHYAAAGAGDCPAVRITEGVGLQTFISMRIPWRVWSEPLSTRPAGCGAM